jgi:hypothetical protein
MAHSDSTALTPIDTRDKLWMAFFSDLTMLEALRFLFAQWHNNRYRDDDAKLA